MKSQFVLVGALCLAGLMASASYAGTTINGTSITFNDATVQSTAKPSDHGGTGNTVDGTDSFIGGGYNNLVTDDYGTIGGGQANQAGDNAGTTDDLHSWASVGGGYNNTASGVASTVGGGYGNTASGVASTVGGGKSNEASGRYSFVAGGYGNTASGRYSFVAGRTANDGGNNRVFVWDDGSGLDATGAYTFNVNASGGIYLNGVVARASGRDMKEAFSFVSAREVLDKVVEMPVTTWRFKSEDDSVRHIGPMAQDFMAAFGYGRSDKHIVGTDADGVALAAIQGLNAKLEDTREELAAQAEISTALRWHNAQLQAIIRSRDESHEARFARLEKAILRKDGS